MKTYKNLVVAGVLVVAGALFSLGVLTGCKSTGWEDYPTPSPSPTPSLMVAHFSFPPPSK